MIGSEIDHVSLQREYIPCAICGQDSTVVRYRIHTSKRQLDSVWINGIQYQVDGTEIIVECKICGLVYVNPRLVDTPGLVPYSTAHETEYFAQSRQIRVTAYRALIDQFSRWLGREAKSLLDIGCGDGALLEAASQVGIKGVGTEISASLSHLVQEQLGKNALVSTDLTMLPQSQFDVITLINVLEHLHNPAEMLKNAAPLLKPGGILLAHVPNLGGLPARLLGVRWHHIEPLVHLYYFDVTSLTRLLQKAEFEPIARFNIIISKGVQRAMQRLFGKIGIYLDNGLGLVARRHSGKQPGNGMDATPV